MDWQPIETIDLEMFREDWELRVLTYDGDGDILLAYYSFPDQEDCPGLEGYWSGADGLSEFPGYEPTHWMPLPPPPEAK